MKGKPQWVELIEEGDVEGLAKLKFEVDKEWKVRRTMETVVFMFWQVVRFFFFKMVIGISLSFDRT